MRLTVLLAATALAAVAVVPSTASARPLVKSVSPLEAEIGGTLSLKGSGYNGRRARNTAVLRNPRGAIMFLKPRRSSRSRLVVALPAKLERLLSQRGGKPVATRFQVRVLAGRSFGRWTPKRRSPVIHPAGSAPGTGPGEETPGAGASDCDKDGTPNTTDTNDDNDLLADDVETPLGLDPCSLDTDNDSLQDGWEYWAAKDLNLKAVPYPGKRPFPNPLDPSDVNADFDGDWLPAAAEYLAWQKTGSAFDASLTGGGAGSPLGYSDGTQTSRPAETPAIPAFRSAQYGIPFVAPAYPAAFEMHADGAWTDDERDADTDGLNNYIELAGPGTASWWEKKLSKEGVDKWPESYYGHFTLRPFANVSFTDADVDGDTLLDAEDDQDNDDYPNVHEMEWGATVFLNGEDRVVNPFNPCAPNEDSRTCSLYEPLD